MFNGAHRPLPIISPFPLKPDTSAHVSSYSTFLRKRLEHGARALTLLLRVRQWAQDAFPTEQLCGGVHLPLSDGFPQSNRGCHTLDISLTVLDGCLNASEVKPNTFSCAWESQSIKTHCSSPAFPPHWWRYSSVSWKDQLAQFHVRTRVFHQPKCESSTWHLGKCVHLLLCLSVHFVGVQRQMLLMKYPGKMQDEEIGLFSWQCGKYELR